MCLNHPERKAVNVCHNCGGNYCDECLTEGYEYYYCSKPECKAACDAELMPAEITCPNCSSAISLSLEERETKKIHCPSCEALIDFTNNGEKIQEPVEYIEFLTTMNIGDVALIKSILDDGQISYYVTGENFLTLEPLIQPARFFVTKGQFVEAAELLKDYKMNIFGASVNQQAENEE
jgi:hypothetical protein